MNEMNYGDSIVFAMSLASKELFHSNLWAWLLRHDPAFFKVFFPEVDLCGATFSVLREERGRDITIHVKTQDCDSLYVIENKLKSYPDKDQLLRYRAEIEKSKKVCFKQGALVSVMKPSWIEEEQEGWHYIDYSEVVNAVAKSIKRVKRNNAVEPVLEEYVEVFRKMLGDLRREKESFKGRFVRRQSFAKYHDDRIDDLCQKVVLNEFANELEKCLLRHGDLCAVSGDYKLRVALGFSHGEGLVDIFYEKGDGKEDCRRIGIQLQGDEYRYSVSVSGKVCNKRLFEHLDAHEWFHRAETNGKMVKSGNEVCEYKKFGDFVFRARKMLDDSVDVLGPMIYKGMKQAQGLLDVIEGL